MLINAEVSMMAVDENITIDMEHSSTRKSKLEQLSATYENSS
jgi:hypothetical protein